MVRSLIRAPHLAAAAGALVIVVAMSLLVQSEAAFGQDGGEADPGARQQEQSTAPPEPTDGEGAAGDRGTAAATAPGEGADADAQTPADAWFSQIFGPGMWPLWICSVYLLALLLERRRALRPGRVLDPRMVDDVSELVSQRKLEEAQKRADRSDTALGKAWSQGLHEFALGGTALGETLTNATLVAFKPLKKNLLAMATIGVITPLLGLLGTIVGMIITFHQIAATGGADKSKLAGGIGLALFTTAGGLIVAIPAIIGNRYFTGRLTQFAEQAEQDINRVNYRYLHALTANPGQAPQAPQAHVARQAAPPADRPAPAIQPGAEAGDQPSAQPASPTSPQR